MISIPKYSETFEKKYLTSIKKRMSSRTIYSIDKMIKSNTIDEMVNKKNVTVDNKDFSKYMKKYLSDIKDVFDLLLIGKAQRLLGIYESLCKRNTELYHLLKIKKYSFLYDEIMEKVFDYDFFIVDNKDLSYDILKNNDIGICPYCNEGKINIIIDDCDKKVLRSSFDHFFPKSLYPIFSISLYNLIPACDTCNRIKLDKSFSLEKNMYPYDDGIENEIVFHYKCVEYDKYNVSISSSNDRFMNNCKELFIENRYNIFCNELIKEKQKTARKYIKSTIDDFKKIDDELNIPNLLVILGYDDNINTIRNKPYSKFNNDISMQIYIDSNNDVV